MHTNYTEGQIIVVNHQLLYVVHIPLLVSQSNTSCCAQLSGYYRCRYKSTCCQSGEQITTELVSILIWNTDFVKITKQHCHNIVRKSVQKSGPVGVRLDLCAAKIQSVEISEEIIYITLGKGPGRVFVLDRDMHECV